jgi:hypothetical protein
MTKILISDLQSHNLQFFSLNSGSNDLVSAAINRALDAREILGGGSGLGQGIRWAVAWP